MSDDRNVFQFDLNESLYFKKGQEVAEMISISLDPEISIQSFDDYVSIRGIIELVGEYQKKPQTSDDEGEFPDFDDRLSKRYIDIIEETFADRAIFSHRFPVEISVPSYRITNIEDITVNVDTFDYELPHSNQLIVKSKIDIYGIHDESKLISAVDNNNGSRVDDQTDDDYPFDETYEFDITNKHDQDQLVKADVDQNELEDESVEEVVTEAEGTESTAKEKKDATGRWKVKSQTLDEFFGKEKSEDELGDDMTDENEVGTAHGELEDVDLDEEEVAEDVEDNDRQEEEISTKDVSYLADMFRQNDHDESEEQKQTKMRLCIVQSDDTLEEIAERYEVTTMQLSKRNDLQDDILTEGQLLYIPSKSTTVDYD